MFERLRKQPLWSILLLLLLTVRIGMPVVHVHVDSYTQGAGTDATAPHHNTSDCLLCSFLASTFEAKSDDPRPSALAPFMELGEMVESLHLPSTALLGFSLRAPPYC